jgi:hypothetical protein
MFRYGARQGIRSFRLKYRLCTFERYFSLAHAKSRPKDFSYSSADGFSLSWKKQPVWANSRHVKLYELLNRVNYVLTAWPSRSSGKARQTGNNRPMLTSIGAILALGAHLASQLLGLPRTRTMHDSS